MNSYEQIYRQGKCTSQVENLCNLDTTGMSYESLFWIAKIIYVYGKNTHEKVQQLIRKAFDEGLSYQTSKEIYLDAALILSRIYFKFNQYELAINYLMYLVDLSEEIPAWIHSLYAYAQLLSQDHFQMLTVRPKYFFSHLDKISEREIETRNNIFIEFITRLKAFIDEKEQLEQEVQFAKDEIEQKAKDYNLFEQYSKIMNTALSQDEVIDELKQALEQTTAEKDEISRLLEKLRQSTNDMIASLNAKIDKLEEENRALRNLLQSSGSTEKDIPSKSVNETSYSTSNNIDISDFRDGHSLLNKVYGTNNKILVLGDLKGNYDKRLKRRGFIEKDFDYISYEDIKTKAAQTSFESYAAILCGPVPHSVSGLGNESSLVEYLRKQNVYMHECRANSQSSQLKFSEGNFSDGLDAIIRHYAILFNEDYAA